ncbi:MAG: sodium-dependent transporter [Ruminococcaceae bacterium]|nr:sodium-dependent transporter [Oscillospiraceae bacterium]
MEKKRAQWGSKLGFILAAAGSAVGLGNIWKFPGRAFEGGGGAFLLIYLLIVIFLGVPLMMTELSIGRASQANIVGAFHKLGHKGFAWVGWIGVLGAFVITCYYSHVGGWVLRYVFGYLTEAPAIYAEPLGYFYSMLGANADGTTAIPWVALLFAAIFMALNAVIIIRGVESGVERFNKVGMPALFLLLLILLVRAVTLPGSEEGLRYMLSIDWSKVSFQTVLSALGQAFYSLSIGMAILITYGSYLSKQENISKNSFIICGMDTLVAVIAGFIVVPAVFATLGRDQVGKGGGFAFVSLARMFQQMPGGRVFAVLFYLLLLFAALTSCISLVESIVAFLTERFSWKRKGATIGVCTVMFLIGCLYTCSQAAIPLKGIWIDAANGVTYPAFCDFMEYFTDRLMIPICALGCCIFVGWVWKPESAIAEIERCGVRFRFAGIYRVLVKYVAPLAIMTILVMSLATGTTLS